MSGLLDSALAQDDGYRLQVLGGFLRSFFDPLLHHYRGRQNRSLILWALGERDGV